jgi:ubiquinone/menaquinone biosynthesis C-methylase UbiE
MNNKFIDEHVDLFLCPDTGEDLIYVKKDANESNFINKFETKFHAKKGFVDFYGSSSAERVTAKSKTVEKDFADTYEEFMQSKQWYHKMLNQVLFGQALDVKNYHSLIKVFLTQMQEGLVLDVPSASALISQSIYYDFPKIKFVAADYSVGMLTRAYQRLESKNIENVILMQAKYEKLPLRSGNFDGIISMNGLNFFKDFRATIKEFFRVSKPGGKVIGTCYVKGQKKSCDGLVEKLLVAKDHFKSMMTKEEVQKALEDAGFKDVVTGKFREFPLLQYSAEKPGKKAPPPVED